MPPLDYPGNDVWQTSAEIPQRWRVNTQTWVVLLIGWSKFSTRYDQSEPLLTRHQYGISAVVAQTSFRGETNGDVVKCQLFSQVILVEPRSHFRNLHSAMTYLNHKTDVAFRPSKLGRVFDFKQHYEVQVMPHIVFGINVFIKGHRFVVKCWAIKTWNATSQSD